jgi:hypothetical protein
VKSFCRKEIIKHYLHGENYITRVLIICVFTCNITVITPRRMRLAKYVARNEEERRAWKSIQKMCGVMTIWERQVHVLEEY